MRFRYRLLVAGLSASLACSNLEGPGLTGNIAMRVVFSDDASLSAEPLDSVFVGVDAIGERDGEGWEWGVMVRTDTTVSSDSLFAGNYELVLIGYLSDQVDAFVLDTVTVVANGTTRVTDLMWSDFFTVVNDIASPTTDTLISLSWQPVLGATGYTVEWSTDSDFGTVTSLSTTNTTATISIRELGDHFVRVRATHPLVTGPVRTSDPVAFRVVTDLQLMFVQQPPSDAVVAGTIWTVTVQARDSLDQPDTLFTGSVTLAITPATNASGATLFGTLTRQASRGLATFDDLSVDLVGGGYTLTATADQRMDGVSEPFGVTAGPPSALAFLVQPPDTNTAGAPFQPEVEIGAVDQFGNVSVDFQAEVTVAITPGTGNASASLSGTSSMTSQDGVATFGDLSIDLAESGYSLTASTGAAGIGDAVSSSFAIVHASPAQWVFTVQPTRTLFDQTISPPVEATAVDGFGNIANGCTDVVEISIVSGAGAAGAVLGGTLSRSAAAGVVIFDDMSIDRSGVAYQLSVTGCGVKGESDPFDITAAPHVLVQTVPSTIPAGSQFTVVAVTNDSLGNQDVTFNGPVDVAIVDGSGQPGATLNGTTSVTASQGMATFSDLSIDNSGTQYRLAVTAIGFAPDTSNAFDVVPGAPAILNFVMQPPPMAIAGESMPVQVEVLDALGNRVTAFNDDVMLSITSGTGTPGASVSNGVTAASAGLASFTSLFVDLAGSNYTLTASAAGLAQESTAFDIMPAAASALVFTVDPTDATAGVAISPDVVVTARDAFGNTAIDFTDTITLTLNGGTPGAVISGVTTNTAAAGAASFPGINIDSAGTGYTLMASSSGLTDGTSALFNIVSGPAVVLQFTQQPTDVIAGTPFSPAVVVVGRDALNNVATGFTDTITLAIVGGTAGANLRDTTSVSATAGRAVFSSISIDSVGMAYALEATAVGVSPDTSVAFDVRHAPAAKLVFTVQPSNARAGLTMMPVEVTVVDSLGNHVVDFGSPVGLDLTPNTGDPAAVLSGGAAKLPTNGRVSFDALSVDSTGNGYTLTATTSGLPAATSRTFNILDPVELVFTQEPTNIGAGQDLHVEVTAKWRNGGIATGFSGAVTLTLSGGNPNATLGGGTTAFATNGVAVFSISVDSAGTAYTLKATAQGLLSGTSVPFDVIVIAPNPLGFGVGLDSTARGFAPRVENVSDIVRQDRVKAVPSDLASN